MVDETLTAQDTPQDQQSENAVVLTVGEQEPLYDERALKNKYSATGRRKRAVARVIIAPGTGTITVNDREGHAYFPSALFIQHLEEPLNAAQLCGKFDVIANVQGGGFSGQAGAIRHGISRAVSGINLKLRQVLKSEGMLTRDAREKERKKYGKRGARASFQFSKR